MFGAFKVFSTDSCAAVATWEGGFHFISFHLAMVPIIKGLHFVYALHDMQIFSFPFEFPPSCFPFENLLPFRH